MFESFPIDEIYRVGYDKVGVNNFKISSFQPLNFSAWPFRKVKNKLRVFTDLTPHVKKSNLMPVFISFLMFHKNIMKE